MPSRDLEASSFEGDYGFIGSALNVTFGTIAAVVKRESNGTYQYLVDTNTSGSARRMGLLLTDADRIEYVAQVGSGASGTLTVQAADGWVIVVGKKATGSAAPRLSRYVFSSRIWTHENASSSIADGGAPGAGGGFYLGLSAIGLEWDGLFLCGAIWNYVLTDAEVESLVGGIGRWLALRPIAMRRLTSPGLAPHNVAGHRPYGRDLTGGGADLNLRFGGVVSADVPEGFGFACARGVAGCVGGCV